MSAAVKRPALGTSVMQHSARERDPCTVLFETAGVEHVREVHRKTQREIGEKQEELRQLVGGSYRELLQISSSFSTMRGTADSAEASLRAVRDGLRALSSAGEGGARAAGADAAGSREREARNLLYGIGCRVKFLVDSPEVVWGFLDEAQLGAAAERLAAAADLHGALSSDPAAARQLASFAVLRTQWPLVGSLRDVISKRAAERLADPELPAPAVASALLAASSLEPAYSTSDALSVFLNARRRALAPSLRGAPGGAEPLLRLVALLQAVVCSAGELFLDTQGTPRATHSLFSVPSGNIKVNHTLQQARNAPQIPRPPPVRRAAPPQARGRCCSRRWRG